MAKRMTIFSISGDPDELFEFKHNLMDPVIAEKGSEYGELVHIAVKNPDGAGITIVKVWESPEGSDRAAQDPEVAAVRTALAERLGAESPPGGVHYEVIDLIQR
jgi:hypothetical protein